MLNNTQDQESLNISDGQKNSTDSDSSVTMGFYIEPMIGCYYGYFIERIFMKHRYNLEPVHLIVINILVDIALYHGAMAFENFFFLLIPHTHMIFCKVTFFFKYLAGFCFYADIITEQIDGALGLYWNVKYKTRVTNGKTLKTIGICKLLAGLCALAVVLLDPKATSCNFSKLWACRYLKRNNVFYFTIPMVVSLMVIICVSIYFIIITHKVKAKVSPLNFPLSNLENAQHQAAIRQSSDGNDQERVEQQPVEDDIEVEDLEQQQQEEPEPEPIPVDNSIQRQNPDPYMFYRVKEDEKADQSPNQDQDTQAVKEAMPKQQSNPILAKEVLKINFVILFLVLLMCPINVFNVIFYVNDINCHTLNPSVRIFGFVQLLFIILYPFLFMAKLKMI